MPLAPNQCMRQTIYIIILSALFSAIAIACPKPAQDVQEALRLMKRFSHREMKTDAAGKVWYLDISEQDAVTDDTLVAVRHLPHLREVYMIYCPIKGDGLANLNHLKEIEKLDLYATRVDDRALKHVAQLRTLKYLDIRSIGTTDKGQFANHHGHVSNDGIAMVADNLPNLESLLFCGTVNDQGLRHLVRLKKLNHVEICSPNVTEDGINWLQMAMPNLKIDR